MLFLLFIIFDAKISCLYFFMLKYPLLKKMLKYPLFIIFDAKISFIYNL